MPFLVPFGLPSAGLSSVHLPSLISGAFARAQQACLAPQRAPLARRLRLAALLALCAALSPAWAEGRLRVAEQYGIIYLLLNVAQERHLIEKHGKADGLDIQVEMVRLSGGAAVNDALLSGNIDIASAGVGPLLTLWDRTRGKQNVRAIASLGSFPSYLVSLNPAVRSIADFTEKDRIALPAVGVSVQARLLQMASAKVWGDAQFARLDRISVTLPHPDATAAIIKGGTEINAHFGSPPFQEQELAGNPAAHVVLSSYDVLGGPASTTLLYTTEKFRRDNPRTYRAFVEALQEAAEFATANPREAGEIYLRHVHGATDAALVQRIVQDPLVRFGIAPQNTFSLAQFMHRVGAIRNAPASVQDYFFDDPRIAGGN